MQLFNIISETIFILKMKNCVKYFPILIIFITYIIGWPKNILLIVSLYYTNVWCKTRFTLKIKRNKFPIL